MCRREQYQQASKIHLRPVVARRQQFSLVSQPLIKYHETATLMVGRMMGANQSIEDNDAENC